MDAHNQDADRSDTEDRRPRKNTAKFILHVEKKKRDALV